MYVCRKNRITYFILLKKKKFMGRCPESNRGLVHPKHELCHSTTAPDLLFDHHLRDSMDKLPRTTSHFLQLAKSSARYRLVLLWV